MEIKNLEQLKKEHRNVGDLTCDLGVCSNKAEYVVTGGDVCVENELRLCKCCAKTLAKKLSLIFDRKN